uniref:Uncharacterized protein n=1 Tax=Anopheles arabiensis TaxID=7173 RepID=A0A182I8N8_ANOAR
MGVANEKADLKSRSDSTSVPPLDSIYTTPTGFHHHHHHPHHAAHHPHQNGTPGSPEAMKTPNSETDCGTVKESLTDDASTGGTSSPLQDGAGCEGAEPLAAGQPEPAAFAASRTGTTVEEDGRCVWEGSSPGRRSPSSAGLAGRSHDRVQGQCAPRPAGTRLVIDGPADGAGAGASDGRPDQTRARLPAKASDYGLERFNRLLDRLDRGNFLIKTSFKKSYSLILMSARGSIAAGERGGGAACGVESSGNDSTASTNTGTVDSKTDGSGAAGPGCNSSSISNSSTSSTGAGPPSGTSGPGAPFKRLHQQQQQFGKGAAMGGSLRGWYPRARGILIKANSSTGIYELAGTGRAGSATVDRADNAIAHRSPTEQQQQRASGQGQPVPVPDPTETAPTNAATPPPGGHNYNSNSLTPDGEPATPAGEEANEPHESDELCRSEVYDNDSGSGSGGRVGEQLLTNRSPAQHASPRKQPALVEPGRNNYENIRPSAHRQRLASLDSASRTLGSGSRKPTGRKRSNAASTGSEWDEDGWAPGEEEVASGLTDEQHQLSSSFPHAASDHYWQSGECAVPTRFFQRQDYAQPAASDTGALDFPPDRSNTASLEGDPTGERASKRTLGKKRWLGGSKGSKSKPLASLPDHGTGNKDSAELPFQLTTLFTGSSHTIGTPRRKRPERGPQLKNINLHFPNKTSHQHHQQQQHQHQRGYGVEQPQHELRSSRAPGTANNPPGALFHQPTGYRQLALPAQPVAPSHHRPGASARGERKYLNKAKSHFLKLGQKWRLLSASGGKPRDTTTSTHRPGAQQLVSSYNLDDLIKATHRYGQENEAANLSQKIVYKSYKSELDLTKNLAYLDSFLNEHFDRDGDRPRPAPGRYTRHKRAKSCSKTLDPSLRVAAQAAGRLGANSDALALATGDEDPEATDSTLEAAAGTVPRGRTTSNLIQLEDVWDGAGTRGHGHWVATNTSSSSSEYLRNNLSSTRTSTKPNVKANKMRDFFRLDGATGSAEDARYGGSVNGGQEEQPYDGEETQHPEDDDDDDEDDEDDDDDDDARMLLFDSLASFSGGPGTGVAPVGSVSARTLEGAMVEHYGKNNATSSSLSSSDYASVYSATSSGGNGAPAAAATSGKPSLHATQFKLLATPEETASGGEGAARIDYAPQSQQHQSSPKQHRPAATLHQPRMHRMQSNNTTNPFVTLSAGEGPAGSSSHRIYNNFLDGSPRHQAALGSGPGSPAAQRVEKNHRLRKPHPGSATVGPVSPRATDRYDYRVQPKPSNSRSHFRQMVPTVLDTDLTYQEDYLEHYQNAARARSLMGADSDTDRTIRLLHRGLYPGHRNVLPAGGSDGEDLQNNALANEHSDNDSDEQGEGKRTLTKVGGDGCFVDDVVTTDELLLLVNAAIDIRRSHAVEQPLLLGSSGRKKHARKGLPLQRTQPDAHRRAANEPLSDSEGAAANEHKALLAYRPHAQLPYELSSNQLLAGDHHFRSVTAAGTTVPVEPSTPGTVGGTRRSFAGLNNPPTGPPAASSAKSPGPTNSYLGYGPHRVIVSQSRKERGEVVLEYEC